MLLTETSPIVSCVQQQVLVSVRLLCRSHTDPGTAHNRPTAPQSITCRSQNNRYSKNLTPFQTSSLTFSELSRKRSSIRGRKKSRSCLNDYLRKAVVNLIRQSVASASSREAAAAPPAAGHRTGIVGFDGNPATVWDTHRLQTRSEQTWREESAEEPLMALI